MGGKFLFLELPKFSLLIAVSAALSFGQLAWADKLKTESTPVHTTIESGDFGIYDPNNHHVTPTRQVHFKVGDMYGWRLRVKSNHLNVSWREEFRLPVAPKTWGELGKGQTIAKDGKTCVTEKTEEPKDGWIENTWPELGGDPLGDYVMTVYVDGKWARTFKFTVH